MAIIGGAGNPIGGSFTGPAEALEIIGDFAYAYSGLIPQANTPVTHLSFTTGNYIFIGDIQLNASVDDDDPSTGGSSTMTTKFNGTGVSLVKADGELERAPASVVQPVIIPPYTEVSCAVDTGGGGSSDQFTSVTMTGRIVRTRD